VRFNRRAYLALTRANLKVYLRSPLGTSSVFLALLFILVAFRLVNFSGAAQVKVGVVARTHSPASERLVGALQKVDTFQVTLLGDGEVGQLLDQSKQDLIVVIPTELGALDSAGRLRPSVVTAAYHAGSPGEGALTLLRLTLADVNRDLLNEQPVLTLKTSTIEAAGSSVGNFFLPGLLAFNLIQSGLMVASGVFASYKSSGVLRRVKATGIDPASFVLAHATASLVLGAAQTAVLLVAGWALFGIDFSIGALILVTLLGYLVFLALGFAVSGWVKNAQQAPMIAGTIGMPLVFVGLFPVDIFPVPLQAIIHYLPVSFVTDGLRQIVRGAPIESLLSDLLGLGLWAMVLLLGATRAFRWD
jgi:ABC-2 type transport system permease protein